MAGRALAPPSRPRALLCGRWAWVRRRSRLPSRFASRPGRSWVGSARLGLLFWGWLDSATPSLCRAGPGWWTLRPWARAEALEARRPYCWRVRERPGAPADSSAGAGRLHPPRRSRTRLAEFEWPGPGLLPLPGARSGWTPLLCHRPWHLSGHCQGGRGDPTDSTTWQRSLVDLVLELKAWYKKS